MAEDNRSIKPLYPDAVQELRCAANNLLDRDATMFELQLAAQNAILVVVALEENWLRSYLVGLEGRIEAALFTKDGTEQIECGQKFARELLQKLSIFE